MNNAHPVAIEIARLLLDFVIEQNQKTAQKDQATDSSTSNPKPAEPRTSGKEPTHARRRC